MKLLTIITMCLSMILSSLSWIIPSSSVYFLLGSIPVFVAACAMIWLGEI